MITHPLKSITVKAAKEIQFKIIDEITNVFHGSELLTLGDLGVNQEHNQPLFTFKVETVLAKLFNAEKAKLIIGAGTGAIRYALHAVFAFASTRKILVHTAPIYPTTLTSFQMLNLEIIYANFNNLFEVKKVIKNHPNLACALVQISRQTLQDSYSAKQVINLIKKTNTNINVITDDNYTVFKVKKIGCQVGADLATFSTFKLSGPEGVGCILGKKKFIDKIQQFNYSGGNQVQGWQAYEVLQGMIIAPVMFAIQTEESQKIIDYLQNQKIVGVKNAFLANAQSKVLIIELAKPIAKKVLVEAEKLGALPNPIGAESKYEFLPLFYRVSATFKKTITNAEEKFIRINPNRAGMKTVLKILKGAIKNVYL